MAINVNNVYQRVLALANKEQRGYITPQTFNLFIEQVQLEIIDQYFYDLNQFQRLKGNDNEYSNIASFIEEKIGYLTKTATFQNGDRPSNFFRLGCVYNSVGGIIEQVTVKEYRAADMLMFTKPTNANPVYFIKNGNIHVKPDPATNPSCDYIERPPKPNWGYVLIDNKPLYHQPYSNDFVLHESEEPEIVYRVLALAGISIKKPQLTQSAIGIQGLKNQQEKQ
tara:strand:+ start:175 stop:846 length:672 start_codon:yes stop_codon:yes gene_type:complete